VRGATISLEIPVLAQFNSGRTVGSLRGIDLDRELQCGRLKEVLKPANLTEFGIHEDPRGKKLHGCIVGGYWRRTFDLQAGQHVTFLFTDEAEDPRALAFQIVGFFEGQGDYLENAAYVDRRFLATQLGVEGRAKTLSVWVEGDPDRPDLDVIRENVRETLKGLLRRDKPEYADLPDRLVVETWREKDNNFYHAVTRENLIMRFIMGFFLLFVVIIIMLILGRLVAEKTRDIGALRAVGATPRGICACFLAQGLAIALSGLAVGLPIALTLIHYLNPIARFFGVDVFPSSAFLINQIPTHLLPKDVILISGLTVLSGVLGALLPALRAAWLNPVECLRHE
jgi:ABC-type lipoprotein release transport system permease subunit